jgi:two-component system sensor kinase FixL
VRGDRVHLQQVLLNLLINGMDALADIRPGDRRLQVSARLNGGGTLEVGVTDSGPGVPADQLAQVFEAFYTTKASGMGMGLPISRTIIEAHGGKLWAENAAAGGAVFRFTLPVVQKETAPV